MCIFGFAGIDFVTVDMAIAYARATSVPLQTTLAGSDLDKIMSDTEPVAIAATMSDLVSRGAVRGGASVDPQHHRRWTHDPRITEDRDRYEAAAALPGRIGFAGTADLARTAHRAR